jgi:hypothetical protein
MRFASAHGSESKRAVCALPHRRCVKFDAAAEALFGSGWVWLVRAPSDGGKQNRRADFLAGWWAVANWAEVARRFGRSDHHLAEQEWEDEGGKALAA